MFHFLFELFTLFFLSFLFQFLLVYSNFFSQKSINNLFENKLPAMGKLAKGEKKTTGSFVIENNENIFTTKACFYSAWLPLNSKKQKSKIIRTIPL